MNIESQDMQEILDELQDENNELRDMITRLIADLYAWRNDTAPYPYSMDLINEALTLSRPKS